VNATDVGPPRPDGASPTTPLWKRSKEFRVWVFASVVWAALAFFYYFLFDPLRQGGTLRSWGSKYDRGSMFFVLLLMPIAGLVRFVYLRLVK
jgi:hypothetical protein